MKYHFKVHKEGSKYWAQCVELQGCNTQGENKDELFHNMKEALNLFLDEPEDSKVILPSPKKSLKGKNLIQVPVEPRIAWASSLRNARLKRGMTQKEAANKLNIKNLYTYQKLESSKTANPELATIVKIKTAFPELDINELISA